MADPNMRKKSLLIGINYVGSQNQLSGCHQDVQNVAEFLSYRGYPSDPRSQIILRDDRNTDPRGPYYPSGVNILAAMDWLVAEENTCLFLHYSGHGGQVEGQNGFDDTIVPVDFEQRGQIPSGVLHQHLVSRLPPSSCLFVILDCCHSGSCLELPYVYRSDDDGNISVMDNLKAGMQLVGEAENIIQGGFRLDHLGEAAHLFSGAKDFFRGFQHMGDQQEEGLASDRHGDKYGQERKFVTMFSGCRDDQTSADATIGGMHEGAMSWAFLQVMKRVQYPNYQDTLAEARQLLRQSNYTQVPQLSVGLEFDLNAPLRI